MCSTAKKMWGTLTVIFVGCSTSMESTITTLTRSYERFFSLRNESLTDTHTRFNALVNDLVVVGITKKNEILESKFLDSLPPKWNNYISSVKLSSVYHDLDHPGLFGLLHNQECSEAEKLIAMDDSYSQPPTALVASMTDHPSSISNEIIPCVNESIPVYSESECNEFDGEEIANEVAMLADKIRRRSFGKFKGKGKSGKADKTKKSYDMSKVTCYKCGKTGHMAGDCRSKESSQAVSSKSGRSEKYSKLKTKYKALKAQVAELSKKIEKDEKSLIAKYWTESATSSEDEEYTNEKCLMAKEKFVEDLIKLQEQVESDHKASTSQTTPPEPPSPPKIQTKGKNSKPIKLVQKSGIGFDDLEVIGQTIAKAVSESDRSGSKGNVSPTKSVSSSNHLESDSDKMISKYVESRKDEISDDKNLLAKVFDPKIVYQSKLRSECKKSGIGKGFAQKETLNVAKKNFKSGKGQIKQQWVSKCDKNVSSVSQSESDPMLRTSVGSSVTFGDDSQGRTEGFGILSNSPLAFKLVSYVNGLKNNLISVSQLCDAGYEVRFRADKGIVLDLEGNVVLIVERDDSLYSFDMRSATVTKEVCFMSKNQDE
uniref:uncharacterized protein LOC122591492 n=1 Tax=Erigeron canadensis TaxID=72917 RepID=UPI001CB95ECB|nr:uncharacterized protein LOC122591492 [Erigeron canadensis]